MKAIVKGREPNSLVECRNARPKLKYSDYRDVGTLQECLVEEQRGICCYCMGRIRPTDQDMKVEHWHSRKLHPKEQLDYSNLLGACKGNEGNPATRQHCDTSKGKEDLSRNPANPQHRIESFIQFGTDGTIRSQDPEFDRELNEVLRLNLEFLKNRRKARLDNFRDALPRLGKWRESFIRKELAYWNGESHNGGLEPYCQVVVDWLNRWLRKNLK